MSFIFRGISNKSWWNKDQSDFTWLQEGELIADVFKGLGTKNGTLSIYMVDPDKTSVNRVIAALTCTRQSTQNFDHVLVPLEIIQNRFELEQTQGDTADDEVNSWHLDIVHLTPSKLSELADLFLGHKKSMHRTLKKEIESQIRLGIEQGYIDIERVNTVLKKKFS